MSKKDIKDFSDVIVLKREKYESELGYFTNTFNEGLIKCNFIQDSVSHIHKSATVKGLHFQNSPFSQAKLVTVLQGKIIDCIVDMRPNSDTYLDYGMIEISDKNGKMLFIPRGFAHGYITLKENTLINYKIDNDYNPENEITVNWKDKTLNIKWPEFDHYFLSNKDEQAPQMNEITHKINIDEKLSF